MRVLAMGGPYVAEPASAETGAMEVHDVLVRGQERKRVVRDVVDHRPHVLRRLPWRVDGWPRRVPQVVSSKAAGPIGSEVDREFIPRQDGVHIVGAGVPLSGGDRCGPITKHLHSSA